MTYPEIAKFMKTAKRGTWQKLGDTVRTLAKLHLSKDGDSYYTEFDARTEGAFFVIAEGVNIGYELLIVFPDDVRQSFDALYTKGVQQALADMAAMAGPRGTYAGLDEFCAWFDNKWSTYSMFASQLTLTLMGSTVSGSSIPAYSNPNHDPQVWFNWIANILSANSIDPPISGYWVSAKSAYAVVIGVSAGQISTQFTLYIGI